LPLTTGKKGATYFTGIDLGRKHDWTVCTSIENGTNEVQGFDRWQKLNWSQIIENIVDHHLSIHHGRMRGRL
jgi:hypothetical protein